MNPDDHVCVCFNVSLRKLASYLKRTDPARASQLSECLDAGTGCHWCVPFLKDLHEQHCKGCEPMIDVDDAQYTQRRVAYKRWRKRTGGLDRGVYDEAVDGEDGDAAT